MSVFDLIDAMLANLCNFLALSDHNDIETFQEADEAEDAVRELHWCRDRVVFLAKRIHEIRLERLLSVSS